MLLRGRNFKIIWPQMYNILVFVSLCICLVLLLFPFFFCYSFLFFFFFCLFFFLISFFFSSYSLLYPSFSFPILPYLLLVILNSSLFLRFHLPLLYHHFLMSLLSLTTSNLFLPHPFLLLLILLMVATPSLFF